MSHAESVPLDLPADQAMYRKITWRIMPLLFAAYVVAFLDRINIGYAQLQMKQTLAFSDAVYALGAGIFFIGYVAFEVPSNLMLQRVGIRKTLLRIMVGWGIVAMAMMFVQTPTQFYVLRFLLGVFEAGFTPGALLYLTFWYPPARRARMIGLFMLGAIAASLIAGPLCGAIMKFFDGANGWHGWQWLFVLQGLPAPLLGIIAWFCLVDRPEQASWLSSAEKARLHQQLGAQSVAPHGSSWQLLRNRRLWTLAAVYVLMVGGTYAVVFWTPTLIKSWGVTDVFQIGLYSVIPQLCAVAGLILLGRSSDRRQERRWHFTFGALVIALGLGVVAAAQGHLWLSLAGLCLTIAGLASIPPIFFAMASELLPRTSLAAGIALISSIGNLGGAVTPSITQALNTASGGPTFSLLFLLSFYLLIPLLVLAIGRPSAATLHAV